MKGSTDGARSITLLDRPIFLVSMPRSGSTLLFETLSRAPGLFTTGRESHERIEQVADFHPRARGWSSNRLTADDAQRDASARLASNFYDALGDRTGAGPQGRVRMLEKTPKNALRVPFFNSIWPDSIFLYLYRDPRETLGSMMEAWSTGRFNTYPRLPGWTGLPWSLLLVPGWRNLIGQPLPHIVAEQWAIATSILINDLDQLPPERICAVDYSALVADPQAVVAKLAGSLGLEWDQQLDQRLPLSRFTVSAPSPGKWRRRAAEIEAVMPIVAPAAASAQALLAKLGRA